MRTIINLDYQAHSTPLFSKLGILDIFHVNTVHLKSPNSCFVIIITYCSHCNSIFLLQMAKFTAMVQEQPINIARIYVVQILRNLLFSTQVLKFGTLFLFQSLVRQIFLALRRKCKSFLRASTYSTSASSPSINYNAVNKNFCTLKRQINDDDDGGVTKKEHKFT